MLGSVTERVLRSGTRARCSGDPGARPRKRGRLPTHPRPHRPLTSVPSGFSAGGDAGAHLPGRRHRPVCLPAPPRARSLSGISYAVHAAVPEGDLVARFLGKGFEGLRAFGRWSMPDPWPSAFSRRRPDYRSRPDRHGPPHRARPRVPPLRWRRGAGPEGVGVSGSGRSLARGTSGKQLGDEHGT